MDERPKNNFLYLKPTKCRNTDEYMNECIVEYIIILLSPVTVYILMCPNLTP